MDTSDIDKPFKNKQFNGKLDVYARPFVLLQELPEREVRPAISAMEEEPLEAKPEPVLLAPASDVPAEARTPPELEAPYQPKPSPEEEPAMAEPLPVE